MSEGSAFWNFTLTSYPSEGVQPSVIALQDNRGADVNVLFFCCYCASQDRSALTADDFARADTALDAWREQVTKRLRAIRDHIKNTDSLWGLAGAPEVRGKVLGAEIESERIAQLILETLPVAQGTDELSPAEQLTRAASNLRTYFAYLGVDADAEDLAHAKTLVNGTFSSANADEVDAAFS